MKVYLQDEWDFEEDEDLWGEEWEEEEEEWGEEEEEE